MVRGESGETRGKRNAANLPKMTNGSFSRSEDEEDGRLLPGLPDDIVLDLVVPKLPWRACYVLSLASRRWREAQQSRRIYDARARSHSTETLFVLNHSDRQGDNVVSLYSMKDNSWHALPKLPKSRRSQKGIPRYCKCISLEGKIYVLGGVKDYGNAEDAGSDSNDYEEECSEVYVLDLAGQRNWKLCANMPQPRYAFGCGAVDGKIYVFGGCSADGPGKSTSESLVYDPKANVWSPISPMKQSSSQQQVVAVGKELFVHSGHVGVEVYHVEKDEWRSLEPRSIHSTVLQKMFTAQGKLYMETLYGICVHSIGSNGKDSWTHLQSCSKFKDLNGVRRDDYSAVRVDAIDVLAGDEELLALTTYANVYETTVILYRSKGFNRKNVLMEWDLVDSENLEFDPFMCPIQL